MEYGLMDPETLYVIRNRDGSYSFARTPDGLGCYWYDDDDEEEARGDVCEVTRVRHFDSHAEFEEWRGMMEFQTFG